MIHERFTVVVGEGVLRGMAFQGRCKYVPVRSAPDVPVRHGPEKPSPEAHLRPCHRAVHESSEIVPTAPAEADSNHGVAPVPPAASPLVEIKRTEGSHSSKGLPAGGTGAAGHPLVEIMRTEGSHSSKGPPAGDTGAAEYLGGQFEGPDTRAPGWLRPRCRRSSAARQRQVRRGPDRVRKNILP